MPVCPRCGEESPERFRHCGFCGAPLVVSTQARRKLATVLFCDVSGSTAMGESLDPESVRELMSRYFRDMRNAIELHGGTVEKFIGDAVMAVFGVPTSNEDDALRAVRAAADMQEGLAALNEELERRFGSGIALRIGVNTGEVVAGDPGGGETFVTGDAVNVAARLEQAASPGTILLGEQTYRLTQGAISADAVEPLTLRGKSEPVPAYRLLEVAPVGHSTAGRLDTGMVGREDELSALAEAFDSCVREHDCQLVTVLGDAGVGKSRLVAEFLERIATDASVLTGCCRSYGEAISYWPLAEAIRQAAANREDHTPEQARERVAALLADEPEGDPVADVLFTAIGLGESAASPGEIVWATRKLLAALARLQPLVLVLDDLHLAEPVFLDLVQGVVTQSTAAPILVLCLARPELLERRPDWGDRDRDFLLLQLEPLGARESTGLIDALLGSGRLPKGLRARVIESAQGNPLFIEEFLGMLIDDGLMLRETGGLAPSGDLSTVELSIPPTLEALLGGRLDRLEGQQRMAIERASVEGQVFHHGAVEALCPVQGRERLPAALQTLRDKELINPAAASVVGDTAFRFRHVLLRDAAYRSVVKRARAELHEQFADWLEQKAGARIAEHEEVIGFHLERAYRYRAELGPVEEHARSLAERAAERLARAGRRALLTRGDLPAAVNLLDRASALLPADEPGRLQLIVDLGFALFLVGELPRAEAVLTEAIERAAAAGERGIELEALADRTSMRLRTDPEVGPDDVIRVAEDAVRYFEEAGDHLRLAKAWQQIGFTVGFSQGGWGAAEEALTRGLAHARSAGSSGGTVGSWLNFGLGFAAVLGPTPVAEAIRRCQEMLAAARSGGQDEASALLPLGRLEASRGRFDEGRELIARARATFEELGHRVGTTVCAFQRGELELLASNWSAAERESRPAYEIFKRIGDKRQLGGAASALAKALYAQGRYEEAEQILQVDDEVGDTGEVALSVLRRRLGGIYAPRWAGTAAKLIARRGGDEEAQALAREAIAVAEQSDALELHGEVLLDLAEVLRLTGAPSIERVPILEQALHLYEAKGNAPSAEEARRLLESLPTPP